MIIKSLIKYQINTQLTYELYYCRIKDGKFLILISNSQIEGEFGLTVNDNLVIN